MNYKELYAAYQRLLQENHNLKAENAELRRCIGESDELTVKQNIPATMEPNETPMVKEVSKLVHNGSSPEDKVKLYMSLFRGREDVYAKRYVSKKGNSGYSPVCTNEWIPGLCHKPKVKCVNCPNRKFAQLNEIAIERHLRGNDVYGIYPLRKDETCFFLAMDFDKDNWEKDVSALRDVCDRERIPCYTERSRSGNGAHVWFFFEEPTPAITARRFGTTLLTQAMMERHDLKLASYDRLFPNQDTVPKGGLGNLIALPLQLLAREHGNSVFIDNSSKAYEDQWSLLSQVVKLSHDQVNGYIAKLSVSDLASWPDSVIAQQPLDKAIEDYRLNKDHFPSTTRITRANLLDVDKTGFSERALAFIRRLGTFKNPEFFKLQAMRMPIYNIPRFIDLSEETPGTLRLPRGCELPLIDLLQQYQVRIEWRDERNWGKPIDVQFNGQLRDEQIEAVDDLLAHELGVLSATTAFGKTVVAANLIAEKKTNTLVLVHTKPLLEHWQKRLGNFLTINEGSPGDNNKGRGRKRQPHKIGQIGAGKNQPTGVVDVAMMQSLVRKDVVKEVVKDYGMIIVDECHHISAFTFERILRETNAKYVYGLTATPLRQDGHHPIVFMQCGPIRHSVDAREQAEKRPFEHYLIPRFTGFRVPMALNEKELSMSDLYTKLGESETRNQQIVNDVIESVSQGRNPLILTQRIAHVHALADALQGKVDRVLTLTGSMTTREKKTVHETLANLPPEENSVLIATGKYVGEGFDEPRLDTLFLAMPIAWKGILQQYAGRLHRLYDKKQEVQVYDYVDVHLGVFNRMYQKRLKGYASMGYSIKANTQTPEVTNRIYCNNNFLAVFAEDVTAANKEIIVVSPYVTRRWLTEMLKILEAARDLRGVLITIVTRPHSDYPEKDQERICNSIELIRQTGVNLHLKPTNHQKFAIIDQRIAWYGSVDLLSYGTSEGSIMRLESHEVAHELIGNIEQTMQRSLPI